jgi:hypothetical protein
MKFNKEKLKKNLISGAGAAAGIAGGAAALYGAAKVGSYFRKRDKGFEKEVRSGARQAANDLVKAGEGRWITLKGGRRFFIPNKKGKYVDLNKEMKFKDSEGGFWKTKLGKKLK